MKAFNLKHFYSDYTSDHNFIYQYIGSIRHSIEINFISLFILSSYSYQNIENYICGSYYISIGRLQSILYVVSKSYSVMVHMCLAVLFYEKCFIFSKVFLHYLYCPTKEEAHQSMMPLYPKPSSSEDIAGLSLSPFFS